MSDFDIRGQKAARKPLTDETEYIDRGMTYGEWREKYIENVTGNRLNKCKRNDKIRETPKPLTNAAGVPITIVEHTETTYLPDSITQIIHAKGGIERNYYGPDGKWLKQISNNGHGNPRLHPYGQHGEHAHDIIWEQGKITGRPMRELNAQEREENSDII